MAKIFDVIIIGGGPVGLYANQYALKKGLQTRLLEKGDTLGGKLKTIYPENPIHDLGGIRDWKAEKLIDSLLSQTEKYNPDYRLKEKVKAIVQEDSIFRVITSKMSHKAKAVIIATGRGIYLPEPLAKMGPKARAKAGLWTEIQDKNQVLGKEVVVVGGAEETVGWALEAAQTARKVTIINWRFIDAFGSLESAMALPANMEIMEPYGLLEVLGEKRVSGIKIFHVDTGEELTVSADAILMARGYLENLSDIEKFGVDIEKNGIKVDKASMATSREGIFAAGDAVYYPGKRKLISTGTSEAAQAVESAEAYIRRKWGQA